MRGRGGLQRLGSSRASQDAKTVPDIVSLRRLQTRLPCIVTKPPVDTSDHALERHADCEGENGRSMQIPFLSLGLPFHSILDSLFTDNPLGISLIATSFFFPVRLSHVLSFHASFSDTLHIQGFPKVPTYLPVEFFRNRINIDQVVKPLLFFF